MKVKTAEMPGFAEFWSLWLPYSRESDGRGKARQEYEKRLKAGASVDDILDGTRFHLRNLKDREFIQLASSFLHGERWADLAPRERDYQRRMAERTQQPKAAPPAASEPVVAQMTQEEREASARRVYEKLGLRPPEVTH